MAQQCHLARSFAVLPNYSIGGALEHTHSSVSQSVSQHNLCWGFPSAMAQNAWHEALFSAHSWQRRPTSAHVRQVDINKFLFMLTSLR